MNQRNRIPMAGTRVWLWAMLALSICSSSSAFAQWELTYGGVCTKERGHNGVAPIVTCSTGGYVSVGYAETSCGSGVYDSYVIIGGVELTIDVSGFGGNDIAYSVIEIPANSGPGGQSGFIVVGTTDETAGTGSTDCYAMELDCAGNVLWVQTYGTAGIPDEARDITLARNGFGPPPIPGGPAPAPGDYVIAGWTFAGLPMSQDALLFRITPLGVVVWAQSYNANGIDFLNAVVEARAMNPGDIVAAGGTSSYGGGMQGLALRVDGNNGGFTAPQHGLADHGGANSNEVFNNVTELVVQPNRGNLVFAGFTTINLPSDIYVVKTSPNPCTLLAQNVVTGVAAADIDQAYDVIWAQNNYSNGAGVVVVTRGDLVLTGEASNASQNTEMFLLTLNPNTLNVAGVAKTYGDITPPGTGIFADGGRSLADDGTGFILCGYTMSNFLFNNDPEQLYLVKTTGDGLSGCENPWSPGNQSVIWTPGCNIPPVIVPFTNTPWQVSTNTQTTKMSVCPRQPCIIKLPNNGNDGGHQGVSGVDPTIEMSSLRSYPNPVRKGGAVTLEFTPSTSNPINVTVTSTLGETIEKMTVNNDGGLSRLSFRTEDLPAGVYIIEVNDGVKTETVRVVVSE